MTSAKGGTARPGGTVFSVLLLLAWASGLAQAGTVRGPAGSLELPEGISASVAPANPVHPNLEVSAVITLQQAATAAGDGAKVAMSCVPSSAGLGSRMGMERLAATTLRLDEALTADKDGEWITLDALPAYRVDAARGDGSRLTQWLVLLSSSFAWIRFDRPQATPIEQAVLEAIAGMKILCAAAAVEAPR